jgi:hypothetical protein
MKAGSSKVTSSSLRSVGSMLYIHRLSVYLETVIMAGFIKRKNFTVHDKFSGCTT